MHAKFAPPRRINQFVNSVWVLDPSMDDHPAATQEARHSGIANVAIQLGDRFSLLQDNETSPLPRYCLSGFMTRPRLVAPSGTPRTIGIQFLPGGLRAFSRVSCHDFADRIIDAREVLDARLLAAFDRIDASASTYAIVEYIRRALVDSAVETEPDPRLAIEQFATAIENGFVDSIHDFCDRTGVHVRQLQRWYQNLVGVSPVKYLRVKRAQRALACLSQDPAAHMADIALRCGYSDQAHLSREFKQIYGVSPRRLLADKPHENDSDGGQSTAQPQLKLVAGADAIF